MVRHATSSPRWLLRAGLLIVLVLFGLPLVFIAWIGWPNATSPVFDATTAGALHPLIIPPAPQAGLPADLILWALLFAGLSLGLTAGLWLLALRLGKESVAAPNTSQLRLHLLAIVGLLSLLAYEVNFALLFPLERYYNLSLLSMGRIAGRDAGVALATAAATVALFLLYSLAYYLCRGQSGRRWWAVVLIGAVLLALVNFSVVTTTSTDIYDNIARGRIAGVYGANPYVYTPVDYPFEPFTDYTSWDDATSAYGPLWETLGAFLGRLAGDHLWSNVLVQKLLALAGYLLSTVLIAAILRRIAPGRALAGTLLFAWSPLALMEGPANAHNDLLMIALLLGAFWFLIQNTCWRRVAYLAPRAAGDCNPASDTPAASVETSSDRIQDLLYGGVALVLLTAAVLVKFVPVLFFPFFLLYLLIPERPGGWRRRLVLSLLLLIPAALLVVEYYGVFWSWPAVADTFTRRAEMFRMSIPSAIVSALQQYVAEETLKSTVREPFLWAFALCYLGVLMRAALAFVRSRPSLYHHVQTRLEDLARRVGLPREDKNQVVSHMGYSRGRLGKIGRILFGEINKGRPIDILLRACLSAILLYILLVSFWFWPWYLIWPLALLALSGDDRLVIPLILACCAGELAHVAWNFVWYWWGISWDTVYQMDVLVVFGLTVPALLAYMVLSLWRRSRRDGAHSNTTPHTDTHDVPCSSAGQWS